MFNSLMKWYSRKQKTVEKDDFNQQVVTYTPEEDTQMFISLLNQNDYLQNNVRIKQASHTGITWDNDIQVGDIIGDRYTVTYINNEAFPNLVYLKEMESNGSHS